jgi:hypothetical protein
MRFALHPFLARFLTGPLARAELSQRKNARFLADTSGYWDYLFVLKKKSATRTEVNEEF